MECPADEGVTEIGQDGRPSGTNRAESVRRRAVPDSSGGECSRCCRILSERPSCQSSRHSPASISGSSPVLRQAQQSVPECSIPVTNHVPNRHPSLSICPTVSRQGDDRCADKRAGAETLRLPSSRHVTVSDAFRGRIMAFSHTEPLLRSTPGAFHGVSAHGTTPTQHSGGES